MACVGSYRTIGNIQYKHRQQHAAQGQPPAGFDPMVQLHITGQQIAVEQHAPQTKTDRPQQADAPVQIQEISAVIPPAHAPFPLQQEAGAILQHGTHQRRQQKCDKRPAMQSLKQKPKRQPAHPIDGQIGAIVHPSVDQSLPCHQIDCCLPQPACKGQQEKQQHIKVKFSRVSFILFPVHGIRIPIKSRIIPLCITYLLKSMSYLLPWENSTPSVRRIHRMQVFSSSKLLCPLSIQAAKAFRSFPAISPFSGFPK